MAEKPKIVSKDLVDLVKLSDAKEFKTLEKLCFNRIENLKTYAFTLPELNPTKLAVDKAFYRGQASGVQWLLKEIKEARKRLKRAEEEEEKK